MDCEKLITLVHERRSLWDRRCKQFQNIDLNEKLWKEVAEIMNTTEEAVRHKWRALRDTFHKELSKLQEKRPWDSAHNERTSQWKFFSNMLFVRDQFPRKATGNALLKMYKPPVEEGSQSASQSKNKQFQEKRILNVEAVDETKFAGSSSSNKPLSLASTIFTSSKITEEGIPLRKLTQLEEELIIFLRQRSSELQDDDLYFAFSLVPYLKQLPSHRKMFVRAKFQEILAQEYETLHHNSVPQQQSPNYSNGKTPSPSYSDSALIEPKNKFHSVSY